MSKIDISNRLNEDEKKLLELDLASDVPWLELAETSFELSNKKELSEKEISLSFVEASEIQTLNKQYRNKDSVTDVLSFEANTDPNIDLPVLGDIVICVERAIEQAKEIKQSQKREFAFLFVHGLLHLLGYDHESPDEEEEMFRLQRQVLEKIGIID